MANWTTAVHVTHETVGKVGGIGAVLHGLFTCRSYLDQIRRSIIIGPLFSTEGPVSKRLGDDGEVLYSSVDGLVNTGYAAAFRRVEERFNAAVVYGRRTFVDENTGIKNSPEVLLIDVRGMHPEPVNRFKKQLYERFGIRSDSYEHLWEYEQYVRLAPAALEALRSLGAANESTTIIAHEFMGMPTVLGAMLEPQCNFRTVFYAHEVATMRRIVEYHPGHDTMFYNVIEKARKSNRYVNDVFGDQKDFFKHPLVNAAQHCDVICAVGDHAAGELRFMAPEFANANIHIVYNGIPACETSVAEKLKSREKLLNYCLNLLGYKPDYVFTHVARLVQSKGLWRDLRVLEQLDAQFTDISKTAVMFLLSTEVGPRQSSEILEMEAKYDWPLAHREGWPDLSGGCLLYTSPSPRDLSTSRMPSSA